MATTLIKRSLAQHEEIIESGVKSFLDVGRSLMAIRDDELYKKSKHDSFESYCSKRWGFTRQRAYQLIESTVVVSDLVSTTVDTKTEKSGEKRTIPENERQARALAESAPDAKTREKVWTAAVASAPKGEDGKPKVTAAGVKKAAATMGVTPAPKPPKSSAAAATNGKATVVAPAYDKQAIEKAYGSLVRLIDDMARVSNQNNSPHHRQCTAAMNESLDEFRKLAKLCDAVQARK